MNERDRPQAFLPTDEDREIAARLRLRRKELKLRQLDLAKEIGISTRTLNRYELLQRAIPRKELRRMEELLGALQPPKPMGPEDTIHVKDMPGGPGSKHQPLDRNEELLLSLYRYMGRIQKDKLFLIAMEYGKDFMRDQAMLVQSASEIYTKTRGKRKNLTMLPYDLQRMMLRQAVHDMAPKTGDEETVTGAELGFNEQEMEEMAMSGMAPPDWEIRLQRWRQKERTKDRIAKARKQAAKSKGGAKKNRP